MFFCSFSSFPFYLYFTLSLQFIYASLPGYIFHLKRSQYESSCRGSLVTGLMDALELEVERKEKREKTHCNLAIVTMDAANSTRDV